MSSDDDFLGSMISAAFSLISMKSLLSRKDGDELVNGDEPPIDKNLPETKTATFSMGCFWGPDALFGSKDGVIRTRVGYAGGNKEDPTYRRLGDHTETIQIDYDPEKITYRDLLTIFWNNHDPTYRKSRQYMSMILYHDEEQKRYAVESKELFQQKSDKMVKTVIKESSKFYLAEDYHQKYHLSQNPRLYDAFKTIYPDIENFVDSTAVARANGLVTGRGRGDTIEKIGLNEEGKKLLLKRWKIAGGG